MRHFSITHPAALVTSLVLAAVSLGQASDNWQPVELPNPSFENGEQLPDGWRALKGNTKRPALESIMAWDLEHARTGQRSLYIRRESSGPIRWSLAEAHPVTPGKRYQVRMWFRTNPGDRGVAGIGVTSRRYLEGTKKLWETGQTFDVSEMPTTADSAKDGWREAVFEFNPPDSVNEIWIRLSDHNRFPPRGEGPIEIWFDDVSLYVQDAPGGD